MVREFDEYSDEDLHTGDTGTEGKDSEKHLISIEERDRIIREYIAERKQSEVVKKPEEILRDLEDEILSEFDNPELVKKTVDEFCQDPSRSILHRKPEVKPVQSSLFPIDTTQVKDSEKYSLTEKERDEIIRRYNVEYPHKLETSDIGEGGPRATYNELLNNIFGIGIIKDRNITTLDTPPINVGNWASISPVFLNEQMRRIHGVIERGYQTDDGGDSSRGWANQELIGTLFEVLGVSKSTDSSLSSLSEGMMKLKQSDSCPDRLFLDNRVQILSEVLEVANKHHEHVLVSPWWVENENNKIPISLPKLLSYGRFSNSCESLYHIGTGKQMDRLAVQKIDPFFENSKYIKKVALRGEMVSAEELARLAAKQEVRKMAVFMMDGTINPVVLGFNGVNFVKLDNKESCLPSHRLTPIDVKPWGDSSKSISTQFVSTLKIALYEKTEDNCWKIKNGTMKPKAISRLLSFTDEDGIRKSDESILSKCLLRLKLGSDSRANPKRMKFLYDSIDCSSLANVLFGNDIHLIEVDRTKHIGEIRALVESEMIGPARLSSNKAKKLLFNFDELEHMTIDISHGEESDVIPWGKIASSLSGKIQSWLHRSIVEGKPIIDFKGISEFSARERYAKQHHIVQDANLFDKACRPDETQSLSIFVFVSLAYKRLFDNIQNGNSLAEILWKTTGYLRSVNFGAPVRVGHSCMLNLKKAERISLRRTIRNTQVSTGGKNYREASMFEIIDSKGNSILQMLQTNQKKGFFFHSLDPSKYDFIPSEWSINNEVLDTDFWLKDLQTIEKWMDSPKDFSEFRKKITKLAEIKNTCYEINPSKPIDVESWKREAASITSSIIDQIDDFSIRKGLSPSEVIATDKFVDTICEAVLLTKNTVTTEPQRSNLSLPYHLDANGMPIKVPNSLCPVSAEHFIGWYASLGSYSRYSSLLNRIERTSRNDIRKSIAIDARPANGGSDVVVLSMGTEGEERMYETENKTYRYTDYQDRYATRQRMLKRILESNEFDSKYHTINFVDAQKEYNKEQVSYMLEPSTPTITTVRNKVDPLVAFIKSSIRMRHAVLTRIKQVASASSDMSTIESVVSKLDSLSTFYSHHFGEELVWKGEKKIRPKAIDWSALAGISIDQSLIRLFGKQFFESNHFQTVKCRQSPLVTDYLKTIGWT